MKGARLSMKRARRTYYKIFFKNLDTPLPCAGAIILGAPKRIISITGAKTAR